METNLIKRPCIADITLRYFLFLLGIFTISLGIAFATRSGLGTLPLSSLPYALSLGLKPTMGAFMMMLIFIAAGITIVALGFSIEGVREGTILAALFTGTLSRVFTPVIGPIVPIAEKLSIPQTQNNHLEKMQEK